MFSNRHKNVFGTSLFVLAFCVGTLLSSAAFCDAPDIYFTDVPPYETVGNLSGRVSGVVYNDYKVLVYIYVSGWWNKPSWASPLTSINPDGSWMCNITPVLPSDTLATQIIAFLIPNGAYQDPAWEMAGNPVLPAELYTYPYAQIPRTPADRAIRFSDHNWALKVGTGMGPGPNNFSDSVDNVWVDANGRLHLKITHPDSAWYCSEIISDESFGYGTYVFTVDSRLDTLDENIVLGLFTWDTFAPEYNFREIDFEFSRWQDPFDDIGQYVIQPWDTPGNIHRFDFDYAGQSSTTTHVMTWRPDGIYFKSYYGDFELAPPPENVIQDWTYSGSDNPPPGGENVRMNLWLVWGDPPSDGLESEIVISDFQFLTGISDQPGDINNDTRVNLADFAQIAARWQDTNCDIYNTWCGEADLTCNGSVGTEDILALVRYWLQSWN
ncbi:MAG: hypothetical protein H8E62_06800 [Planctomycetes bacterium]|nr:hypothetical protein [Planctomycetota bacterium]